MSLPRPLNWLRESDTSDDAEKVLIAANEVKLALEEAQNKLAKMEEENNEEGVRLQENLQENIISLLNNIGGVPRNQYIVSTWIPFNFPDDAPESLDTLKFSAVPFPTPELAIGYGNAVMGVLQSIMSSTAFIDEFGEFTAANVEEQPSDVVFNTQFFDADEELVGEIKCKFWQYNPEAERPGETEEQGDWV